MTVVNVRIARSAGFCMGVRKALDIVLGLSRRGLDPIYTDGPLIHNPQIISMLEEKGIRALESGAIPPKGIIVIRAHGVSPRRRGELAAIGLPIHDATCPDVAKAQGIVSTYAHQGFAVVIVGDRGHAEVDGLLGFSGGMGRVIGGPAEVGALPTMDRACVVAQTTQDGALFRETAALVAQRVTTCMVCDTICRSTKRRQKETIALAREVDVMVVVGGRNSANTARLVTICRQAGTAVFHVESEEEIDRASLCGSSRIGVTGGASTPRWVIERVAEELEG